MPAKKKRQQQDRPGEIADPDSEPQAVRSRARLWCFRLIALFGVPAVLLGAVEGVLRLTGYGYDPAFVVRDEVDKAKVRDNGEFALRFFPPALARSPQPIRVAEKKADRTIRILLVGGSAAMGDPEPSYGPARVLQVLLDQRFPERKFEVINAAVTAINSHVVLPIVRDCMRLEPDLVIVYLGNNEVHGPFGSGTVFGKQAPPLWVIRSGLAAKTTKLGQWLGSIGARSEGVPPAWGGLEMFLQQQVARDDPRLQTVYRHFEDNLRDLAQAATGRGAKVLLSTVAVNLKDFPPFVSLPREPSAEWLAHLARAEAAQETRDYEAALAAFQHAEQLTPDHAELQFRTARCLLEAGRVDGAREKYQRARDLDALRFRADSWINEIITEVAAEAAGDGVLFIDAAGRFAAAETDGIPGDRFFWEHVHFNFEGSYFVGRLFAEKVGEALALSPAEAAPGGWLVQEACLRRLGLTPFHRREVIHSIRRRLRSPPFSTQLDHDARQAKLTAAADRLQREMFDQPVQPAIDNFEKLIAANPEDWMLRKEFAAVLIVGGQTEAALAQRREISRLLPHYPDAHYRLGALLNHAGKWKEAEEPLRRAIRLRPNHAPAYHQLAIALARNGSPDKSHARFAKAVELMPGYAEAYLDWAEVLFREGNADEAADRLRQAIAVSPDHLRAHHQLGQHYVKRGDFANAAIHCEEVVRLAPRDPASYLNLGMVCLALNKRDAAIEQFRKALELDPRNKLAGEQLRKATAGSRQTE